MRVVKVFLFLFGAAAAYCGFVFSLVTCTFNMATAILMWSKLPEGLHMQVWGWNAILVFNSIAALLLAGALFFGFIFLPRKWQS